jgi:hypothetical protein
MFIIHGKGNQMVWDPAANSVLGKFNKGLLETEDEKQAKRFRELGYQVDGLSEEEKTGGESPLANLTVEELMEYAKEKGIDIGKSTSQSGILNKILAAQKETENPDGSGKEDPKSSEE